MKRLSGWLKKYFIPHGENDFKPHFLRHESAVFIFLLLVIVELGFLLQVFVVFDKTSFLASVLPGVLTALTNEERAQNNVPPLVQNDLLTKAAQLKANDMATRGYFAHTSPEGITPWYWFSLVGYNYTMAGENLAVNFFESDDVARAWMKSPSHRDNIVKKGYTDMGIGVAKGIYEGRSTVYVAQFFGTSAPVIAPALNPPTSTTVKQKITPPAPKPTPKATPAPAPTQVAIVPTAIQILGEATNAPVVNKANSSSAKIKSFIEKVLASPREYVSYVYGGILLLVILALALVLFIRARMAHPFIVARGAALAAFILFLLFLNIRILNIETKVPADALSASVIAY